MAYPTYKAVQWCCGPWTITDDHSFPIRTHDSYAQFSTKKEAEYCRELMERAYHEGQDDIRKSFKALLDIEEPEDAIGYQGLAG